MILFTYVGETPSSEVEILTRSSTSQPSINSTETTSTTHSSVLDSFSGINIWFIATIAIPLLLLAMCGVLLPVCVLRARASRSRKGGGGGGADNIYDTIQKRDDTSCRKMRVKATRMEGTDRE